MALTREAWLNQLDGLTSKLEILMSQAPYGYARYAGIVKRTTVEDLDQAIEGMREDMEIMA